MPYVGLKFAIVKEATAVEGYPKAPFSVATTPLNAEC